MISRKFLYFFRKIRLRFLNLVSPDGAFTRTDQGINEARMEHFIEVFPSLGKYEDLLTLEIGAGIGLLTPYFLKARKGGTHIVTEGRSRLVKRLEKRLDQSDCIEIIKLDLEDYDVEEKISAILWRYSREKFDICFAYGVLYHVSNPGNVLEIISKYSDAIILETQLGYNSNTFESVSEPKWLNQAIHRGSRPNPDFIMNILSRNFSYSLRLSKVPNHSDFISRNGHEPIRGIFLGSQTPIELR